MNKFIANKWNQKNGKNLVKKMKKIYINNFQKNAINIK